MISSGLILLIYGVIYVSALVLAVRHRNTFPLGEALGVLFIVGVGFTGLVYLIVPLPSITMSIPAAQPAELVFTLSYLVLTSIILTRNTPPWFPTKWNEDFIKKRIHNAVYKLLLFVLIPIVILQLFWSTKWVNLGFSFENVSSQLSSAALLIFLLGGFNLLVGGGAAPIRTRSFSGKQLATGFGLTITWAVIEAGLVEEFFFRAFLQTRLISYLGSPISGICVASLLFGLAHAPGIYLRRGNKEGPLGKEPSLLNSVLYSILALSTTGWFMGLLFWRTQSLLIPVLVHGSVDAVAQTAEFIKGFGLWQQSD